MRISVVFSCIVAAFAVAVSATNGIDIKAVAAQLPPCATNCFITVVPTSPCTLDNTACLCTTPSFETALKDCLLKNCKPKEALTAQKVLYNVCERPAKDYGPRTTAVIVATGVLALLSVALRIAAKVPPLGNKLWWDDYTLIVALCLTISMTGLTVKCQRDGFGKPNYALDSYDRITYFLYYFYIGEKIYISCVWVTKVSLLILYLRLFPDRDFRRKVYVVMAICVSSLVAFVTATVFVCWPISYSWTSWDGEHQGKCTHINAQGWANAVANMLMDLVIMVMPLRQLSKLQLPTKKKLFVYFMFTVGSLVTVLSAVRLRTLIRFGGVHIVDFDFVSLVFFSFLEANIGIFCACMPGMFMFFRHVVRRISGIHEREILDAKYGRRWASGGEGNWTAGSEGPWDRSPGRKKVSGGEGVHRCVKCEVQNTAFR